MTYSIDVLLRSILFNVLFYANLIVHMIAALPTLALPYPAMRAFIRSYARTSLWLLRVICRTGIESRGDENIPPGGCLVACKHQSLWETFALYVVLSDPVFVLKRELIWIPLFGWYLYRAGMIPIDRSSGFAALARMTARAKKELGRGRQVVVFPEGTRRAPGAAPDYKPGITVLYDRLGVACIPFALNSGLFWPRRSLIRFPGTVLVEALPPIPSGLDKRAFFARLQNELEKATARLVGEGKEAAEVTVRREQQIPPPRP